MSTTAKTPDDESGFKFLEALLGGAPAKPEPTPEPTPEEIAEATAAFGESIQNLAAIALGVRARAVEAGVDSANADVMAMSTYAVSLQGLFGGANG